MKNIVIVELTRSEFYFNPDFHSFMHNPSCGLKPAPNHKIVLTQPHSERILLLSSKTEKAKKQQREH
jgi:hypothetical protein